MRVRDFMKTEVITVEPKTPIMDALDVMKKNNIRHLPVTQNGKFSGWLVTRLMNMSSAVSIRITPSVIKPPPSQVNGCATLLQIKDLETTAIGPFSGELFQRGLSRRPPMHSTNPENFALGWKYSGRSVRQQGDATLFLRCRLPDMLVL